MSQNYLFLFAVIVRRKPRGYYDAKTHEPIDKPMSDVPMCDAYYERVRDGAVLPTCEYAADMNERARRRDYQTPTFLT